ncbi:MAG: Hsp20/alpha crystallin family protein [Deltaproteobacteria bacterium]|nr:Hsp20/alpha crystallin family protein [Deltaproteobacteria bacterium]MBW1795517.1 Hsp20/alpha crystallin family protein [Deltaproteobacteria bacterium]MBW2331382.1 Hsp20/alpha crystallin family protein [Deltaproteobacteria bacterium]
MEYIKIRFGKNLGDMHSRLQKTIDDMLRQVNPMLVLSEQTWRPQMDMYETPEEIIIVGEISGVDKEDLEVELDQKAVKITGLRRETARVPGIKYHLAEIVYGKFERILLLPLPINPEEVKASYTNGLLKVTMPKSLSREARQIPIQGE